MKKLFLLVVTVFSGITVFAYPITPRPLRKLVMESEYIIRGLVIETGTLPVSKNESSWERDFARILVQEVWQGAIAADTITVYYTSGLICPAPAVYIKGAELIAFLDKQEKGSGYETHALSYGVKYQGLSVYKARIKEIQQILQIKDVQQQETRTLDWLVECAADQYTRWEGVYELLPESDFMSAYDRDGRTRKDIFLGTAQRERLFTALMAIDTLNYDDIALVDIVQGINDPALLQFLKSRLTRMDDQYLWPATGIMHRIVQLTGSNDLESIYRLFNKTVYEYNKEKESRSLLADFVRKMENTGLKRPALSAGNTGA